MVSTRGGDPAAPRGRVSAFTAHAAAWRNRLARAAWCVEYGEVE
jgi:hypothetical protein